MLHDVKIRIYDRITKRETIELVTVDAAGGDDAAEAAQSLRPGCQVVGVTPKGGFGEVGGAGLEADEAEVSADDEDSEPGPSNRELAAMGRRVPHTLEAGGARGDLDLATVKRGPGRPRKEPQS